MDTPAPLTVCIVPRERYSLAVRSLDSVLAATPAAVPIVYLDGASPPAIASALRERCEARGAHYLPAGQHLSPSEARSRALAAVTTPFLIFIDNDVFPQAGWTDALLACAEETGAWAVSPLVLEGSAALPLVHMAGGDLTESERNGSPTIQQRHRLMRRLPMSIRSSLRREPCGFFEYHGVLLRRYCFERGCTLYTGLSAVHEHIDLALQIRRAGGEVYFEPGAVIRYDNATRFSDDDRAFFELRWSEPWTRDSIEHFRAKWHFADDDPGLAALARWAARHRELFRQSHRPWLRRALPLIARREGRFLLQRLLGHRTKRQP